MRTMRFPSLALYLLVCPFAGAAEPDAYVCVTDLATGFVFDKNTHQWRLANFKPGTQFLISRKKPGEYEALAPLVGPYSWKVVQVGQEYPEAFCKKDFENGLLWCSGDTEVRLNREALRFIRTSLQGFWAPVEGKYDLTPSLEIGRCSPL